MHLRPAAAEILGAAWTRHRFLDRPASQTRNATKHNDTQPKHNSTQPIHNKTQPKPIKTQTKHNHTQIGPNPQSAEGGGAKHIIIIIITEVSLGWSGTWSQLSVCQQVTRDHARTHIARHVLRQFSISTAPGRGRMLVVNPCPRGRLR